MEVEYESTHAVTANSCRASLQKLYELYGQGHIDDTQSYVDNMFLFLVYGVLTDKMDPQTGIPSLYSPLGWGPGEQQ